MIMKEKAQKYKHSDVFQLIASQLEVHDIFVSSRIAIFSNKTHIFYKF